MRARKVIHTIEAKTAAELGPTSKAEADAQAFFLAAAEQLEALAAESTKHVRAMKASAGGREAHELFQAGRDDEAGGMLVTCLLGSLQISVNEWRRCAGQFRAEAKRTRAQEWASALRRARESWQAAEVTPSTTTPPPIETVVVVEQALLGRIADLIEAPAESGSARAQQALRILAAKSPVVGGKAA